MSTTLRIIKPVTEAEKVTHTALDTLEVTPAKVRAWKIPGFQRPLKVNAKVLALAEKIKGDGGVIPGVITIGVIDKEQYLLDGQHRREAFLISECEVGYVDVRMRHFKSMAEMGDEFVELNSQLVRMGPNDVLRGLEGSTPGLSRLRRKCPFIGYDQVRRGEKSPMVSMSSVLRCWFGSATEVPKSLSLSASETVKQLNEEEADVLAGFMTAAMNAWGRDQAYQRLWGNLNLIICMWLYRRTVITPWGPNTPKLTKEQFERCLMSVSAASIYVDWLAGRNLSDRDRSPCYQRVKSVIAGRLEQDLGKKVRMPQPPWSHG